MEFYEIQVSNQVWLIYFREFTYFLYSLFFFIYEFLRFYSFIVFIKHYSAQTIRPSFLDITEFIFEKFDKKSKKKRLNELSILNEFQIRMLEILVSAKISLMTKNVFGNNFWWKTSHTWSIESRWTISDEKRFHTFFTASLTDLYFEDSHTFLSFLFDVLFLFVGFWDFTFLSFWDLFVFIFFAWTITLRLRTHAKLDFFTLGEIDKETKEKSAKWVVVNFERISNSQGRNLTLFLQKTSLMTKNIFGNKSSAEKWVTIGVLKLYEIRSISNQVWLIYFREFTYFSIRWFIFIYVFLSFYNLIVYINCFST